MATAEAAAVSAASAGMAGRVVAANSADMIIGGLEKPPRKWHDVVEPTLTFFR